MQNRDSADCGRETSTASPRVMVLACVDAGLCLLENGSCDPFGLEDGSTAESRCASHDPIALICH